MKEIEFITFLDTFQHNRLRVRLVTDNGELIDIMFQYETVIDGDWVSIVRYDCAHGFFHRDIILPDGSKEKRSIEIDNLKVASKYAEQDLKDRWEWYKENYINKFKKKRK